MEIQVMLTYESSTLVTTWMARKTTAIIDSRRCISCTAKPGQFRARTRDDVTRPSTMVAVSRTSVITPVARVMYQNVVELIGATRAASARSHPGGPAAWPGRTEPTAREH